jgi:hypothetical protein
MAMSASSFERKPRNVVPTGYIGKGSNAASRQAAIRGGLAELRSGQRIPLEEVETWVESWESSEELPMPECRRN